MDLYVSRARVDAEPTAVLRADPPLIKIIKHTARTGDMPVSNSNAPTLENSQAQEQETFPVRPLSPKARIRTCEIVIWRFSRPLP